VADAVVADAGVYEGMVSILGRMEKGREEKGTSEVLDGRRCVRGVDPRAHIPVVIVGVRVCRAVA
jgi:hypothetical protein